MRSFSQPDMAVVKPPLTRSGSSIVSRAAAGLKKGNAMADLTSVIEQAWDERETITPKTKGEVRKAVDRALAMLDQGEARVAEKRNGEWVTNQWLEKAVLLSFRLNDMVLISSGPGKSKWWDKVPSKFDGWTAKEFRKAGFRAVPSCVVRHSAYIAPGVIL